MDNLPEKRFLKLPALNRQLIKSQLTGIRPFRKNGVRVEKEVMKDKTIFHNYGHGSSGITVAPATALEVAELVDRENVKNERVAVMGSGIAGITSALQLAKRGYKVKVYSKIIPNMNKVDNSFFCTSEVASGFWHPAAYFWQNDKERNERALRSYKIYTEWSKIINGIDHCMAYIDEKQQDYDRIVPECTGIPKKPVHVYFSKDSNKYLKLLEFQTIRINIRLVLQQLINECKKHQVKFMNYMFSSIEDVLRLSQDKIVNCLGVQSRKLFADENLYGLKGHHIYFQNAQQTDYILSINYQGYRVSYYCHRDKIIVGQSKELLCDHILNKEVVEKVYSNAIQFKNQYEAPSSKL